MNVLIAYSTTDGHTRRIADFLATKTCLAQHNLKVISVPGDVKPNLGDFDAVVVTASIHAGQYRNEIVDYATINAGMLNRIPCAFLSVGLSITNKDPEARRSLEETTRHFLEVSGWKPVIVEQVAGALLYTQYGFIKKMLIRSIMKKAGAVTDTSRDHIYTDWDLLRQSMTAFVERVEPVLH